MRGPASEPIGRVGLGMRAIRLAARDGDALALSRQLEQFSPRAWARPRGAAPVAHLAARAGSLACLELLLAAGAPLGVDENGVSALMCAAHAGSLDCVQALAPLCDPLAFDRDGVDALMRAARAQATSCVQFLCRAGDPSRKDRSGFGAVEICARHGDLDALAALARALLGQGVQEREIFERAARGARQLSPQEALGLGSKDKPARVEQALRTAIDAWSIEREVGAPGVCAKAPRL